MCEIYQVPALQEEKGCLVQEKPLGHLSAPPGDLRVSPEASSWHTLPVYLPVPSPMARTSWLPIISQTCWAFSDQVVYPLWKAPPSTCSFILIHLGWFHPPIFQSFHQMLYFPGSLLCTTIQRSSLLPGKILAPGLSASYSLYHIHSTKIYYVFCTPSPVLGSRDVAVGNRVCVCTLGVGGGGAGWDRR